MTSFTSDYATVILRE